MAFRSGVGGAFRDGAETETVVGSRGLAGFLEEAHPRGARRPRGGASLGVLPEAACGESVLASGAVDVGGPSSESPGKGGDPAGRFPGIGPG